jgi:alanyl-tRNA synthetase
VLGEHVQLKGSLNDDERLRFDFSHFEAMTAEQLAEVEKRVNDQIRANSEVVTEVMEIEAAKAKGAAALFGEKYDDTVRVLSMGGDFSIELCGGTHATRTGDIGLLKIISEAGVAAGVRRVEAVTGLGALNWLNSTDEKLSQLSAVVKGSRDTVVEKVQALSDRNRQLEKELEQLKSKLASQAGSDLLGSALEIGGAKVLAAQLEGIEAKALRDTVDQMKNKLGSSVVVLATVADGKVALAAGVSKDLTAKVKAGDLIRELTAKLGGKGGGRPDFAQGGGSDLAALPAALESVAALVEAAV